MPTRAPTRAAASSIVVVRRATSSARSSSGLKRRSTENHAVPGTTLKFAPLPGCAAHDEHRPARLVALERVVRAAREQLVREVGERLGDLHHLRERVDAEMRLPDVRRPALHLDAQRDRAAARVPDDAAGRLGGDHRERAARRSCPASRR